MESLTTNIGLIVLGIILMFYGLRSMMKQESKESEKRRENLTLSTLKRPGSLWDNGGWEDHFASSRVWAVMLGFILVTIGILNLM